MRYLKLFFEYTIEHRYSWRWTIKTLWRCIRGEHFWSERHQEEKGNGWSRNYRSGHYRTQCVFCDKYKPTSYKSNK